MRQTIYLIYNDFTKFIADSISNDIFVNKKILIDNLLLTPEILSNLASECKTEYFYIIICDTVFKFSSYNFDYKPEEWDSIYVHIWNNNDKIRLYNKQWVLEDPDAYDDETWLAGNVTIKHLPDKIYEIPEADIIFISYDEPFADKHYKDLLSRFPRAKRVNGIKGIFEAHKAASRLAKSPVFYAVDADAKILPTFNFSYFPQAYDFGSVHVWHSINPINDLEYGYGGVKLFPTHLLQNCKEASIDLTTSVSSSFKVMREISNITCFNTDPFSTWRSAFRECVKLASGMIVNTDNEETEERLRIWCTVGEDREYGDFALMGANEGTEFGERYRDQPEMLKLINDYEWLSKKFGA
jgi:hypothetical protein